MLGEVDFVSSIDEFPWESEVQKKGYLSLVLYMRKNGYRIPDRVDPVAAFLIQKSHESHEWHINLLSQQIEALRQEIIELRGFE